ncbi:YolD-like family protein [Bacillus cereus]|uniref:YolD-like family protein n=1 Tax=Bacillus cereus TaxID=1396 RepID=A0A9W7PZG5_BACCE|nr:YolD-like family protein [Bacillus cereus]KAA6448319.1 YolD-like family protein [Bacillus cereus]
MVKWNAFASLPEQFQGINEIFQEQSKIKKPILDQQQLEKIGQVLQKSISVEEEIHILYYRNGYIHNEIVTVIKIDSFKKEVITTDAFRNPCIFGIDEIVDCYFTR